MIRPGFLSSPARLELEACVRRQREDHGIARRANAILLLDDGKSCQEISDFLYLDDDTIRGWYKSYRQDGWDALAFDGWKGGQSRMTRAQEATLCAWLEARFCRSTVEIRAHVAAEFGVKYSHSGCIKLLARLGFEYRKPKPLPRVASAEKQAAFIALYEKLMRGLPADEAVYFADAVHPEYQTKPAFGWVKVGSNPAVLSTAGRGRVNIHGAVNLETFDAPFVEPTTVDGVSAVQLLTKVEERNPDKRKIAGSQALQADALDFLGDALTYGLSLAVIGMSLKVRSSAALLKGFSLLFMGLWVFGSTVYQIFILGVPSAQIMGLIGLLALAANLASVMLLMRYKDGDANVRSVWLCSRNDAIGNVAVMIASVAVLVTASAWPDLIVAIIMARLFLRSAQLILVQAWQEFRSGEDMGALVNHGHDHAQ